MSLPAYVSIGCHGSGGEDADVTIPRKGPAAVHAAAKLLGYDRLDSLSPGAKLLLGYERPTMPSLDPARRRLLVLRCLTMAAEEQFGAAKPPASPRDRLMIVARQYGRSFKVERDELESVLEMTVHDLLLGKR